MIFIDGGDVRLDRRLLVGGKPVELLENVGEAVVDVCADLFERVGVLVERILVVNGYAVTKHDGI